MTALPLIAALLTWPFLLLIPGWLLAARLAPGLTGAGRAGAAIAISVAVSTHLVNVLSLVLGYGLMSVLVSVWLLVAASAVLARVEIRGLAPPPASWRQAAGGAVAAATGPLTAAFMVAAAAFLSVGIVLSNSAFHRGAHGYVAGGFNWSDWLLHVSIGASIQHSNFPPEVPYFAGRPLVYHWFGDFSAGIASTASGLALIPVMEVSNAVMAAALALLVYELALHLTGSRRAAALAAILAVFGGGMGYIRLPLDVAAGRGTAWDLIARTSYDEVWLTGWPYFRVNSVFGAALLAQRATAYGLPMLVASALLLHLSLRTSSAGVFAAGVLAALIAPFHFLALPAAYLAGAAVFVAHRHWRGRAAAGDAVLFWAPGVLALPFFLAALRQEQSASSLHLVAGWQEAPWKDGLPAVAFFYATNLGIPFLLAIAAVLVRRTPARVLLAVWAGATFLLPNVLTSAAVAESMNKFFQMMWIPVAILAGSILARWRTAAVAPVLVLSCLSPALSALWHVRSDTVALTYPQYDAARWIDANTPDRSVFVTDAFINSPVDLAGRLRVTGLGTYVANLGYDPGPRERDVRTVYCAGPSAAAAAMRRYRARYVLSSGGLLDCHGSKPTDFDHTAEFITVYSRRGVSIWELISP